VLLVTSGAVAVELRVEIEQLTTGPKHHFFGYIGHVRTVPWNQSGRYIVALQTDFQDRMPKPGEPADVILIDTWDDNRIRVVDQTRAWNPQQGTMLYWEFKTNRAMREGDWKLAWDRTVRNWELYDLASDRTETRNLASEHPERVTRMSQVWSEWAVRTGVAPAG
jgi:hypothetical protein